MEERYTYSDSLKAMLREAPLFNYILFFMGVAISVFCFGADGNPEGYYAENWLIYWVVSYFLILTSILMPLNKIKYLPFGGPIFYVSLIVLAFIFILLFREVWAEFKSPSEMSPESLEMLGYSIAATVAIFGWFIQHQLTRQHNKVSHSLNILLQMRVSEEFQRHMKAANEFYSSRTRLKISDADITKYHSEDKLDDKIKSIESHIYLLNYYEFLAYGIKSGTLDEELLFQTLGGIVIGHFDRAEAVIRKARELSPKVYESLVNLEDRWKVRRQYDDTRLKKKLKEFKKGI